MSLMPREIPLGESYRLLRISDVMKLTGLPKSTIYLKIKNKEFPNQVSIGSRSVAWVEKEINEWILNSVQSRKSHT